MLLKRSSGREYGLGCEWFLWFGLIWFDLLSVCMKWDLNGVTFTYEMTNYFVSLIRSSWLKSRIYWSGVMSLVCACKWQLFIWKIIRTIICLVLLPLKRYIIHIAREKKTIKWKISKRKIKNQRDFRHSKKKVVLVISIELARVCVCFFSLVGKILTSPANVCSSFGI